MVTVRALTITARDSDTRCPGTAGLKCGESVLTGESLPAGKRHRASQAHEDQLDHPYRHEPAILPAKRQSRQANPGQPAMPRFWNPTGLPGRSWA